MVEGQTGIFALGTAAHGFFEFALREGSSGADLVRAVASYRVPRTTGGGTNLVAGFRPELWSAVGALPPEVRGFNEPLKGAGGYKMPATQADAFVWLAAASYDVVFDMAHGLVKELQPLAKVVREFTGWTYRHNRDLTGFEDGTKNPTLELARAVALVESGPGEGGSLLLFQQWRHETAAWEALGDERQEKVIGRTKPDSVEFSEATMPPDSHVARTTFKAGDKELKIFRRNVPYGNVGDHGTLFIGFAAEQRPLQGMLEQMAGADGGPRDALTRFTTPLSGAYYFCPSVNALAEFTPAEED